MQILNYLHSFPSTNQQILIIGFSLNDDFNCFIFSLVKGVYLILNYSHFSRQKLENCQKNYIIINSCYKINTDENNNK